METDAINTPAIDRLSAEQKVNFLCSMFTAHYQMVAGFINPTTGAAYPLTFVFDSFLESCLPIHGSHNQAHAVNAVRIVCDRLEARGLVLA